MDKTKEWMSLTDVAAHLGVHYMTAYRYVRTGQLRATRRGARWWVAESDLGNGPGRDETVAATRGHPLRSRYADRLQRRLVAGDERGARQLVESALAAGATPSEVHVDIIGPALRAVGQQWEDGHLGVGDEHLATSVALRLIGWLGPLFLRRGKRRGTVVLGSVPGDRHSIPVTIASDILRERGFDIVELGADVPAESFAEAAAGADRLVAVGACVTLSERRAAVSEVSRALESSKVQVPLIVGGAGWQLTPDGSRTGAWSSSDVADLASKVTRLADG